MENQPTPVPIPETLVEIEKDDFENKKSGSKSIYDKLYCSVFMKNYNNSCGMTLPIIYYSLIVLLYFAFIIFLTVALNVFTR
jgi:hypothetical protein